MCTLYWWDHIIIYYLHSVRSIILGWYYCKITLFEFYSILWLSLVLGCISGSAAPTPHLLGAYISLPWLLSLGIVVSRRSSVISWSNTDYSIPSTEYKISLAPILIFLLIALSCCLIPLLTLLMVGGGLSQWCTATFLSNESNFYQSHIFVTSSIVRV